MRRLLLLALIALSGCSIGNDDGPGSAPQLGADANQAASKLGFPLLATRNTLRVAGGDSVADVAGTVTAVFPATSATNRPRAVVLVDRKDWQGVVAASVLSADPLGTPILLSDGGDLPEATKDALDRMNPRGSDLARDAQVIRVGAKPPEPSGRKSAQLGAPDPFRTAAAIDRFFTAIRGEPSPHVMLVAADKPSFAMPAAAWAARSGDSVLFVEKNKLPAVTKTAIVTHSKPDIYLLGPESVISPAVEKELDGLGRVTRVSGETAVENAIALARFSRRGFGWGIQAPGYNLAVASTKRPADAAAAATLATNGVFAPLLLTDRADRLPSALDLYLRVLQPGYQESPSEGVYNRVWILGDQKTVSLPMQGRIDEVSRLIRVQARNP
jgi:hypothetical protein